MSDFVMEKKEVLQEPSAEKAEEAKEVPEGKQENSPESRETSEGKPEEGAEKPENPEEAQEGVEKAAEKPEEPQEGAEKAAEKPEEPQEGSAEKPENGEEAPKKAEKQEGAAEAAESPEESQESSAEKPEKPEEAQEGSEKAAESPEEAQEGSEEKPENPEEPQEGSAEKPKNLEESQDSPSEKKNKARAFLAETPKKVLAFLRKKWKWACGGVLVAAVAGCAVYWYCAQPRFHDLTVELGTQNISIEDFMTKYGHAGKAGIVTDLSTIDIGVVGSYALTLRSGSRDETVTLTVEDTTPPKVQFVSRLEKTPDYQPDPYDFVSYYEDLSQVTVRFVGNVVVPLNYEEQTFNVIVEDACGNAVTGECTLSVVWLRSEYAMELGEVLCKEDLLFNPERDGGLIRQEDIDAVNASGIGEYTVAGLMDESVCQVRVADTTPPELIVTDVSVFQGEEVTLDSFVEYCTDASGDVELSLLTAPDVNTLGIQTMTIEARDINGNVTTATATLAVVKDKTPPVIRGLSTLSVEKRSNPDYMAGVSATDKVDGACEVAYDARGVDLTRAGTYYVTYTSKDQDGNTAKVKRTVIVEHDQEDTDALVESIAAGLGSDPEAIRDYVRDSIKYSHNSGGKDPVWQGFANKSGDCLVHACCLQSLLTKKGYETQLIWVTDRSHYWLIIHLDGVWRHIDATPGVRHTKYSLMTDAERYSILQGRNWDRSAWPACE